MNTEREKLRAKIRALLSKTEEAGCSEEEALAAAAKAAELMDKYHVQAAEIDSGDDDPFAEVNIPPSARWHVALHRQMAEAIGRFTGTVALGTRLPNQRTFTVTFYGRFSDAIFARWLCAALRDFVLRGLETAEFEYRFGQRPSRKILNLWRRSYLMGAGNRIADRLDAITKTRMRAAPASNALTVASRALAARQSLQQRVHIQKDRRRTIDVFDDAYEQGEERGDAASFAAPIGKGHQTIAMIGRNDGA